MTTPLHPNVNTDATKRTKLAHGMAIFVIAIILFIAAFLFIWYSQSSFEPASSVPNEEGAAKQKPDLLETGTSEQATLDSSGKVRALEEIGSTSDVTLLQGPEAGQIVAPPRRDVTPGFQLSPLHQTMPLTRTSGSPLPPPPEHPPLPKIFRKVVVTGPTQLKLILDRNRTQTIQLAYLRPPDPEKMCWFSGQNAKCSALAATALRRFIRQRAIGCDWVEDSEEMAPERRREGNQIAQCYIGLGLDKRKPGEERQGMTDLGGWLVRFGWARPQGDYYGQESLEAQSAKRGLYSTEAVGNDPTSRERIQEISDLSNSIDKAVQSIDLSSGLGEPVPDDALTLIAPSKLDTEKKLALPPGFE